MRKDMAKVLTTTARRGGGKGDSRFCRGIEKNSFNYENAPKKESIKKRAYRAHGWGVKELNEYLNPLENYMKRQVGRPWSKVYSEVCKNMDKRSAVGLHIFEHIDGYIARKAYWKNGILYNGGGYGVYPLAYKEIYVCPKDGIIKRVSFNKKVHKNDGFVGRGRYVYFRQSKYYSYDPICLSEEYYIQKLDNKSWWCVTFKEVQKMGWRDIKDNDEETKRAFNKRYHDAFLNRNIQVASNHYEVERIYGPPKYTNGWNKDFPKENKVRYVSSCWQLSKSDIKQIGLNKL